MLVKTRYLLLLLLILQIVSPSHAVTVMKVSVIERAPWGFIEGGKPKGVYTDITQLIAKELGIKIQISVVPFLQVAKDMQTGDSVFCFMSKNYGISDFSESLILLRKLDIVFSSKHKIKSIDDLNGKDVAILRGTSFIPNFEARKEINQNIVNSNLTQIEMLALGHADAVLAVYEDLQYSLQKLIESKNIEMKKLPNLFLVGKLDVFVHISNKKRDRELEEKIVAAVEKIKLKGEIEKILTKYIQNWKRVKI